ncbi:MAG: aminoacyl-histidine dipeptidase [Bacteroidales bacterium]|nr:aminoacyl-histidine dipeptidase [Bacteroidales bacterium]
MSIKDLQPTIVWNNFYGLTQVPRPSKHEEKVREYLYNWGVSRGLETFIDDTGNVIIRKPATPGYENLQGVILQGHMDMVPQKTAETKHDFLTDPIQTEILGEWVGAKGTTLGADNGMGIALALAVLEDETVKHGPIECLFTYDEETGMTGAKSLKPGILKGDILFNLDSETEGEIYIGCAGGLDASADFKYLSYKVKEGYESYKLTIKGLQGGHSGMDIILYRANANKVAARIVDPLLALGARVVSFKGGSLRNAIPFEAEVELLIPEAEVKAAKKTVKDIFAIVKAEFAQTDPSAECHFEKAAKPYKKYIQPKVAKNAIKALQACPNGVDRMSPAMAGLVETSNNMAVVRTEKGHWTVHNLLRSSIDTAKDDLAARLSAVFELAGATVSLAGGYSGWAPRPDMPILKKMQEVYNSLYGKEPAIMAIHAGLECAIMGANYPNWDMVSFGPTLVHPHSPDERCKIDTVGKVYDFLKALLVAVPEK